MSPSHPQPIARATATAGPARAAWSQRFVVTFDAFSRRATYSSRMTTAKLLKLRRSASAIACSAAFNSGETRTARFSVLFPVMGGEIALTGMVRFECNVSIIRTKS